LFSFKLNIAFLIAKFATKNALIKSAYFGRIPFFYTIVRIKHRWDAIQQAKDEMEEEAKLNR